jgi:hypothetical protein
MKKRSIFLAMVFALVFAFATTGCNDSDSNSKSKVVVNGDDSGSNTNNDNKAVPTADGVRRCTLCDSGQNVFNNNTWLEDQYEGKVIYIVLRAEKSTYARKIYVAGVTENGLTIHNQRNVTGEVTPAMLNNIFGVNFYKFGPGETIVNDDNWESKFPVNALFYSFNKVKGKVKFNQKRAAEVSTFDCQRELSAEKRIEAQSLLPLGPRVATTDGKIAGEVLSTNPPMRATVIADDSDDSSGNDGSSGSNDGNTDSDNNTETDSGDDGNNAFTPYLGNTLDCQNDVYLVDPKDENDYNFQDEFNSGEMFAELNIVNASTGKCKLKLNLKVSEIKIVTINCCDVFILPGWTPKYGDPINLNDLNLGVTFSIQYPPKNGGPIDTIWIGVVESSCYSSYSVGYKNWQFYIEELTIFIEVNKLHIDGIHKIKLNVRYGNTVYTFDCIRDVEEHRAWSAEVLADYVTGYNFTFQGIPTDAYRTEDTVWLAVSSKNKPSSIN